jgi:hypothetical protein
VTQQERELLVEKIINDEINQPEKLQELSAGLAKGLKVAGLSVVAYYVIKNMIHTILTDRKFIVDFSQKIADRLEYLEIKAAEKEHRAVKHKTT